MTARIAISHHADERIVERLVPKLGAEATGHLVEAVLDAAWNQRYSRFAPDWLEAPTLRRGDTRRYVVRTVAGVRLAAVVCTADPALPRIITVLTDDMGARVRPLAPLPTLADGRVIGRPRRRPLPVAFQQVAA